MNSTQGGWFREPAAKNCTRRDITVVDCCRLPIAYCATRFIFPANPLRVIDIAIQANNAYN